MANAISSQLRFATTLVGTSLKASMALRASFWMSVAFMVANNVLFFSIWWIFFDRFDDVRGWRLGDVGTLYGVVATGFGLAIVFAGGVRELARLIADGELDVFLSQPKSVLLHTAGSRSYASGVGDLLSGVGFLVLSGVASWETAPLAIVAVLCTASLFVATAIIMQSAAFWLGRVETLARTLWEFLLTFSLYPASIFSGALRLLLFTLVPAGFIGHLPVELLRSFSWAGLGSVLASVAVYWTIALLLFRAGLRRYASGSRLGVRA